MALNTEDLCGKLDKDRGYNMNTVSGKPIWPADPRPEDIREEDIVRSLSRLCRFNGHLKEGIWKPRFEAPHTADWVHFEVYSVAQHSCLVHDAIKDASSPGRSLDREFCELLLAALFHDASEYVLGDMIKPQKRMYAERSTYEHAWDRAIEKKYGLREGALSSPPIKDVDYRMFLTEVKHLCNSSGTDFGNAEDEPYDIVIWPWLPSRAYDEFMHRLNTIKHKMENL